MNNEVLLDKSVSDLFVRTADALQDLYKKMTGKDYTYGHINFIFHAGTFHGVQEENGKTLFKNNLNAPPIGDSSA